VTHSGQVESTFFTNLLSCVIPALLFFGLWTFLVRRMAGGGLGGRIAPRLPPPT
jgi:cell division protease FtsH